MRRLLLASALLVLAACTLPPAPPAPAYSVADGWAAIDQAFADYGPGVQGTFHCIAERESHHNPAAVNGQYRGILQLGAHYQGALDAAAATLGRPSDWFDPYVNARAGRIIWEQSGTRPWSTRGGC